MRLFYSFFLLFLFGSVPSAAQSDSAAELAKRERELKYQQGKIVLRDGLATLEVPQNFRYLDPDQSAWVLEKAWGNPPTDKTLGMLLPTKIGPLSPDSWAVVITYEEDGYVKDDEAEGINYNELLKSMREDGKVANEERAKQGYEPIELVGWAAPPRYDKASHKLYWAKELQFGSETDHTLNYNIRALGRRGVLVLNAVASMKQLSAVEKDMVQVLKFVDFSDGHRYADFKPNVDKVAAYGIGALIAGKVAAKVGLFKLLVGLLVAAKKFVALAVVAIGSLVAKLLRRRSGQKQMSGASAE